MDYYEIADTCIRQEGLQFDCRDCRYFQHYNENEHCKDRIIFELLKIIDTERNGGINMNTKNDDFYWFCRKIYAMVCDLVEEENNIKITSTRNAEIFVEWMRDRILTKEMIGRVENKS